MNYSLCRVCGNGLATKAEKLLGVCIKCVAGLTKESQAGIKVKRPSYGRLTNGPLLDSD